MPRVVTCLLEHDGRILILKRSQSVGTYKGLWGGVAGFVEEGEEPLETAYKEIREEVGLRDDEVVLVRKGDPVRFTDVYAGKRYEWEVHPFLFHVDHGERVRIDWEHEEFRWVLPADLKKYGTVPRLDLVLGSVWK